MIHCPFCEGHMEPFSCDGKEWGECTICRFRFVQPQCHPDIEASRRRYLEHNNTPENSGYRDWLAGILSEGVIPYLGEKALLIDYGCGHGIVPQTVFTALTGGRNPYRGYDPLFHPDNPRNEEGDHLLACEVVEHFSNPHQDWSKMLNLIRPGGYLTLSTLFAPVERSVFQGWWYKRDFTHLSFYTLDTLLRLQERYHLMHISDNGRNIIVYRKLS